MIRSVLCLVLFLAVANAQPGWLAEYYQSKFVSSLDIENRMPSDGLVLTQIDDEINFTKFPYNSMFGVRWQGTIRVPSTRTVQFRSRSDDGFRLFLNGEIVINHWSLHAPSYKSSAKIELIGGVDYAAKVEFFEHYGNNVAELYWKNIDTGSGWEIVPSTYVTAALSNFISWDGMRYATLGDDDATCQEEAAAIPDGWELATAVDTNDIAEPLWGLLQQYPFNTNCVVLADGTAVKTRVSSSDNRVCGTNQLETSIDTVSGATLYIPSTCDAKVLIQQTVADEDAWTRHGAFDITNKVSFDTKTYATVDNVDVAATVHASQDLFFPLPSGWKLVDPAADGGLPTNLHVAVQGLGRSWASSCVVLSDGTAWSVADGSPCQCPASYSEGSSRRQLAEGRAIRRARTESARRQLQTEFDGLATMTHSLEVDASYASSTISLQVTPAAGSTISGVTIGFDSGTTVVSCSSHSAYEYSMYGTGHLISYMWLPGVVFNTQSFTAATTFTCEVEGSYCGGTATVEVSDTTGAVARRVVDLEPTSATESICDSEPEVEQDCSTGALLQAGGYVVPKHAHSRVVIERDATGDATTYLGCWVDDTSNRAMQGAYRADQTGNTIESCVSFCAERGFLYAGAEYAWECFCGDTYDTYGPIRADTECNSPCAGDFAQKCGGGNRLSVYSTAGLASWDVAPTIDEDELLTVSGVQYATMDAAGPLGQSKGCQDISRQLPVDAALALDDSRQWKVAEVSDSTLAILRVAKFSTECVVLSDGSSWLGDTPCPYVTEGANSLMCTTHASSEDGLERNYCTVNSCNQRVLMTRVRPPTDPSVTCGRCIAWGDPHYTSLDGKKFDFQGANEFLLAGPGVWANPDYADFDLEQEDWGIHTRQQKITNARTGQLMRVAVHKQLGVYYKGDVAHVTVSEVAREEPSLIVNGEVVTDDSVTTPEGITITKTGSGVVGRRDRRASWKMTLPNHIVFTVRGGHWNENLLDAILDMPELFRANSVGLCGSCDNDATNDYYTRQKEVVDARNNGEVHNKFGLTWEEETSIFEWPLPDGAGPPYIVPDEETPPPSNVEEEDISELHPCEDLEAEGSLLPTLCDKACSSVPASVLEECRTDCCMTGDTGVAEGAAEAAAEEAEAIVPAIVEASCAEGKVSETITVAGRVFGVLIAPSDTTDYTADVCLKDTPVSSRCQSETLSIPEGWSVADNTWENKGVVATAHFHTDCLILSDGKGFSSDLSSCSAGGGLAVTGAGNECIGVSTCNSRVLLVKDPVVELANPTFQEGLESWEDVNEDNPAEVDATVVDHPLNRPVVKVCSQDGSTSGIEQFIDLGSSMQAFSVGAWVKVDAAPTPDDGTERLTSDISVYADITYSGGGPEVYDYGLNAPFVAQSGDDSEWVFREVSVFPTDKGTGYTMSSVRIHVILRNHIGCAYVGGVDIGLPSLNYIQDPFVDVNHPVFSQIDSTYPVPNWIPSSENAYTVGDSTVVDFKGLHKGTNSICVTDGFAYQGVELDTSASALYIGGASKVSGIGDGEINGVSPDYAIYMDVLYVVDGTTITEGDQYDYGLVAEFSFSADWQTLSKVFPLRGSVASVTFNIVYRNQAQGTACFDDLFVLPLCAEKDGEPGSCFTNVDCDEGDTGTETAFGDPHLVTADGLRYDVQSRGEYILVQDGSSDLEIQIRNAAAGVASIISGVAVRHGFGQPDFIQIERASNGETPRVLVNGMAVLQKGGVLTLPSGNSTLTCDGPGFSNGGTTGYLRFTLDLNQVNGDRSVTRHLVDVTVIPTVYGTQYLSVQVTLPATSKGETFGLLGNFNGDPSDDLRDPDGKLYDSTDAESIEYLFAESWRVTSRNSIFTYDDGEGPETFYQVGFEAVSHDDFGAEEVASAQATCEGAGVLGPNLDACVGDLLFLNDAAMVNVVTSNIRRVENQDTFVAVPIATENFLELDPTVDTTSVQGDEVDGVVDVTTGGTTDGQGGDSDGGDGGSDKTVISVIIGVSAFVVIVGGFVLYSKHNKNKNNNNGETAKPVGKQRSPFSNVAAPAAKIERPNLNQHPQNSASAAVSLQGTYDHLHASLTDEERAANTDGETEKNLNQLPVIDKLAAPTPEGQQRPAPAHKV